MSKRQTHATKGDLLPVGALATAVTHTPPELAASILATLDSFLIRGPVLDLTLLGLRKVRCQVSGWLYSNRFSRPPIPPLYACLFTISPL